MNSEDNLEVTAAVDHQKTKHLVKSQYYDVMVKVDTDVYYLDKLQLAWKSDYFEKFLIEYSNQEECSLIELRAMDSDTFSTVTDIIYGKTLTSVLNHDNCIALLMAMDYLQMEIDVETYATFMKRNSVLDVEIFGLYTFMKENPNLQCLLPSVLEYLSNHLVNMRNNADLLCLPVDDMIRIISSQSYAGYSSMTEDMREICLICAEWIYHDLENRLPHSVKLVNAVKQRFCYLNAMKDEDFNNLAVSSDIAKQMNPEMIAKHFYKFVVCDGEINPVPQKLPKYEEKKAPISCEKNHRKKLTKLLENGYFHNTVLNVGEKTYKLHRFKLCPASAHFAEISSTKQSTADAQCAETLTQRSITSEQYLILGVDQTTCDMIFEYVYFDELRLTSETITPVFKAASTFRMEKLMTECVRWMKKNIEEMCSSIDSFPISFISFDMLEDLLISSSHFCDNPHRIKNVCTKWVFYDVKNRYHLIPRIALAINRNRTTSYKMEVPTDLNDCTERMIRYELWKTLKSTSLIPIAKKTTPKIHSFNKKLCEVPVFVAWTWQTSTIHVLNARLGQIASLCLCLSNSNPWKNHTRICLVNISAALVDDNLFIMLSLDADYFVFYVFNSSSKKFISLNSCVNAKLSRCRKFSLLSCRGQIYCCFNLGHVLKYSIELNHWRMFSKKPGFSDEDLEEEDVWFTSDGDKLYRLYASNNGSSYVVEEFNFKLNLWLPMTYMSFTRTSSEIQDLTIINGDVLTVVYDSCFKSFDPRSRTWRRFPLTGDDINFRILKSFASIQYENIYLHVFANKLHQWSETNQCWELKEELQLETTSPDPMENLGLYECIGVVHGHDVRTPRQLLYR